MSSSEPSSSDSEIGASAQVLPQRGNKRKAAALEPPQGAVLIGGPAEKGEFDWDSVRDDKDIELWLVRVPDSVRPVPQVSTPLHSSFWSLSLAPSCIRS